MIPLISQAKEPQSKPFHVLGVRHDEGHMNHFRRTPAGSLSLEHNRAI
jgi:hypothetical protein